MKACGIYSTDYSQEMAITWSRFQRVALVVFLVVLFALPLFTPTSILAWITLLSMTLISVTGLGLLTGYCGQVSLGQAAFMAVGAYTSGILGTRFGMPFLPSLVCAGLTGGVLGILFGLPSFKTKGFYLVMTTIGAHFIIIWLILHLPELTGGSRGLHVPPPAIAGMTFATEQSKYYLIVGITVIMILLAKNLVRSKTGRAFVAIRDNDIAAATMGVNVGRYKLLAFFLCCLYASVSGALFGHYLGIVSAEQFTLLESIWQLGMLIVGGMGSIMGIIFGVVFLRLLRQIVTISAPVLSSLIPAVSYEISASLMLMVFSLAIIITLIFEPRGLNHLWQSFKAKYRIWPFPY